MIQLGYDFIYAGLIMLPHRSRVLEPEILKLRPFMSSLVCLLIAIKNCAVLAEIEAKNIHITSLRLPLKYLARVERVCVCVTLSYSRRRRMSAVRSGSAQYKRWHSSIIKAYAETLGVQTACYTQHIYNFLASPMFPPLMPSCFMLI